MKARPAANPQTATLAAEIRVMAGQLRRRLREQSSLGDLTESQLGVLRRLDSEGPATVSALARAEGMRPQSMGANIAALETAGLVSGTPDPGDGRQTIWSLTAACRERVKAGRIAREDWLYRTLQSKLTATEQADLARAVELLKRLVEP
jgi:DNA-binding MarR family transcriptional regulator